MPTETEVKKLIGELVPDKAKVLVDVEGNLNGIDGLYLKIEFQNCPPSQPMVEAGKYLEENNQNYQIKYTIAPTIPKLSELGVESVDEAIERIRKLDGIIDFEGERPLSEWTELLVSYFLKQGKEDEARELLQKMESAMEQSMKLLIPGSYLPENYYFAVINLKGRSEKCAMIRLQKNKFEMIIGETNYRFPEQEFTLEKPPVSSTYSDILNCYLKALGK